ncbi:MAG: DUF393 domain-containing protein, partial [Pseudomonadota bacterium]
MTPLTVYFDGECPICNFEVAFYQRRDKFHLITWTDITQIPDGQLPRGKSRPELLGKFHTIDQSGRWHIGVDAFHAIWQRLPWFSHFAPLFITPGIRQLTNIAYRYPSHYCISSYYTKVTAEKEATESLFATIYHEYTRVQSMVLLTRT